MGLWRDKIDIKGRCTNTSSRKENGLSTIQLETITQIFLFNLPPKNHRHMQSVSLSASLLLWMNTNSNKIFSLTQIIQRVTLTPAPFQICKLELYPIKQLLCPESSITHSMPPSNMHCKKEKTRTVPDYKNLRTMANKCNCIRFCQILSLSLKYQKF